MAATNKKTHGKLTDSNSLSDVRLAGGQGAPAARQSDAQSLRRLVMTCLLWEKNAYCDGISTAGQIASLIPLVPAETVRDIAIEARNKQKLRHVPLFICREMARHESHRGLVASTLATVVQRPDELTEFLSLYLSTNERKTLSAGVKKGLAAAFGKFGEYQLAKWNREGKSVSLRDAMRLCHPKPANAEQSALWGRLIKGELKTPNTWEVGLSAAKTVDEKRAVWVRMIGENSLGAMALLKNLRNMQEAGVSTATICGALRNANPAKLLPIDFIRAQVAAPDFTREIEDLMYRCVADHVKLTGETILVVDVSGSMVQAMSGKTKFSRLEVASSMAILAAESCEHLEVWVTAGDDYRQVHKTEKLAPFRGFALRNEILRAATLLGGGGIFTRQCLEHIKEHTKIPSPDRIIVFSDSQDCDRDNKKKPSPFGKRNYIVDVSCHQHGVNYRGAWTAEVSGWSEHFLDYIGCLEDSQVNP